MDYILRILKKVYAASSPDGVDDGQQDIDEAKVCDAMIFHFNFGRFTHWLTPADLERLLLFKLDVDTNQGIVAEAEDTIAIATVAAAALIGDEIPLSLASNPHVMWKKSLLFGTPFCVAVFGGKFSIVLHALRSSEFAGYPANVDVQVILIEGVEIALKKEYPLIAEIILSFMWVKKFPAIHYNTLSRWLDSCVSCGYSHPVLILLQLMNARPNGPPCIEVFIKACQQGSVIVVYHLIYKGWVNVNQAMSYCAIGGHPLAVAIRVAPRNVRVELVEHLLAFGANPNGYASTMNDLTGRPLVAAVQPYNYWGSYPHPVSDIQGGIEVIVALLNAGADPQLVNLHGHPDTGQYASSLYRSMSIQLASRVALQRPDIWGQSFWAQIGDQPLRFWSRLLA